MCRAHIVFSKITRKFWITISIISSLKTSLLDFYQSSQNFPNFPWDSIISRICLEVLYRALLLEIVLIKGKKIENEMAESKIVGYDNSFIYGKNWQFFSSANCRRKLRNYFHAWYRHPYRAQYTSVDSSRPRRMYRCMYRDSLACHYRQDISSTFLYTRMKYRLDTL